MNIFYYNKETGRIIKRRRKEAKLIEIKTEKNYEELCEEFDLLRIKGNSIVISLEWAKIK